MTGRAPIGDLNCFICFSTNKNCGPHETAGTDVRLALVWILVSDSRGFSPRLYRVALCILPKILGIRCLMRVMRNWAYQRRSMSPHFMRPHRNGGWEESVLNRIFCVGNVAQTPQAGYIWITSASLRFGRNSYKKICARQRLICRPGYARNQVVGIVPPSIM